MSTSSTKQQMLNSLQTGTEYRRAFVEEAIRARIAAQIHALRSKNEWDYKKFAEKINKKVSWAYRLEDPNEAPPTIPTLLEVAATFDIGLDVRFFPFSELLDDVVTLNSKSFAVPSFNEEMRTGSFLRRKAHRKIRSSRGMRVSKTKRKPLAKASTLWNRKHDTANTLAGSGGLLQEPFPETGNNNYATFIGPRLNGNQATGASYGV